MIFPFYKNKITEKNNLVGGFLYSRRFRRHTQKNLRQSASFAGNNHSVLNDFTVAARKLFKMTTAKAAASPTMLRMAETISVLDFWMIRIRVNL